MFIFFLYFILNPSEAFIASADGILLWFEHILPTLLPFSILSGILLSSHFFEALQRFLDRHHISTGPILPAEWFVIVCGFFFGFPIGSKLSADLREKGFLTQNRAQLLCSFANNMSPVFISVFVCENMQKRPDLVIPYYLILYGPALCLLLILLIRDSTKKGAAREQIREISEKKAASRFQIDIQIIDTDILNSFLALIKLCGYIVLFSLVVNMVSRLSFLPTPLRLMTIGLCEVTNGIAALSAAGCPWQLCFVFTVLFLALGGISGIAQTGSMIQKAQLSLGKYLKVRFLLLGISTLLATMYVCFLC